MFKFAILIAVMLLMSMCDAGSKDKPHPLDPVLTPYDGKHIPYSITAEQSEELKAGKSVRF